MTRIILIPLWLAAWLCGSIAGLQAADVQLYGALYRPVADVAAQYDMKSSWLVPDKTMRLENQYCRIDFTVNERSLHLNGQPMALGSPIVENKGMIYLSKRDFDYNILPLLSPRLIPGVPSLTRIVIDPGHGGKDPGGEIPAAGVNEKTNTLDLGLRLAAVLQKRGYNVVMTRNSDVTLDRKDRPILANRAKGDLYISVHFNKADDTSVSGVETWILTPPWQASSTRGTLIESDKILQPGNKYDYWNAIIGFSVERAVTSRLEAVNRGIKRARYDVLVPLDMPGLLVECGFLTNNAERAKILTPAYRQTIAEAIADGVDLYKSTLDRLRPRPPVPLAPPTSIPPGKR